MSKKQGKFEDLLEVIAGLEEIVMAEDDDDDDEKPKSKKGKNLKFTKHEAKGS